MTDSPSSSTHGQERAAFMRAIRTALGGGRTDSPPQPPSIEDATVRLAQPDADLIGLFTRGAEAVGMIVRPVDADALLEQVVALLAELNAKRAATAVTSLPEGVDLDATLTAAGVEMVDWQQLDPAHAADVMYDVDVGITDVHAALAETGTLICRSDAAHPRALSLIPTVHVAIVQAADILPDMIDYWAQLRDTPGPPSSSTAFITGPSKTADIEGQLVQGVHGPEQVYILLVRAT